MDSHSVKLFENSFVPSVSWSFGAAVVLYIAPTIAAGCVVVMMGVLPVNGMCGLISISSENRNRPLIHINANNSFAK